MVRLASIGAMIGCGVLAALVAIDVGLVAGIVSAPILIALLLVLFLLWDRDVGPLRRLLRRRPFLQFDGEGLECAAGRIWWGDVERIVVRQYPTGNADGVTTLEDWLSFSLRPRVEPLPAASRYDERHHRELPAEEREAPEKVEIPMWTEVARVLVPIRRFYNGPILDTFGRVL